MHACRQPRKASDSRAFPTHGSSSCAQRTLLGRRRLLHLSLRAASGGNVAPTDLGTLLRSPPPPLRPSSLPQPRYASAPAITHGRCRAASLPAWIRSRQEAKVPLEARLLSGFVGMSSAPYRWAMSCLAARHAAMARRAADYRHSAQSCDKGRLLRGLAFVHC